MSLIPTALLAPSTTPLPEVGMSGLGQGWAALLSLGAEAPQDQQPLPNLEALATQLGTQWQTALSQQLGMASTQTLPLATGLSLPTPQVQTQTNTPDVPQGQTPPATELPAWVSLLAETPAPATAPLQAKMPTSALFATLPQRLSGLGLGKFALTLPVTVPAITPQAPLANVLSVEQAPLAAPTAEATLAEPSVDDSPSLALTVPVVETITDDADLPQANELSPLITPTPIAQAPNMAKVSKTAKSDESSEAPIVKTSRKVHVEPAAPATETTLALSPLSPSQAEAPVSMAPPAVLPPALAMTLMSHDMASILQSHEFSLPTAETPAQAVAASKPVMSVSAPAWAFSLPLAMPQAQPATPAMPIVTPAPVAQAQGEDVVATPTAQPAPPAMPTVTAPQLTQSVVSPTAPSAIVAPARVAHVQGEDVVATPTDQPARLPQGATAPEPTATQNQTLLAEVTPVETVQPKTAPLKPAPSNPTNTTTHTTTNAVSDSQPINQPQPFTLEAVQPTANLGNEAVAPVANVTTVMPLANSASAVASPSPSPNPSPLTNLYTQLAPPVAQALQTQQGNVTLQLNPFDLGSVRVQVQQNPQGELTLRFVVQEAHALTTLQSQEADLRQSLADLGLNVSQVQWRQAPASMAHTFANQQAVAMANDVAPTQNPSQSQSQGQSQPQQAAQQQHQQHEPHQAQGFAANTGAGQQGQQQAANHQPNVPQALTYGQSNPTSPANTDGLPTAPAPLPHGAHRINLQA